MNPGQKTPSVYAHDMPLWLSVLPVLLLIVALSFTVYLFGDEATSGPSQIVLFICGTVTAGIAVLKNPHLTWHRLEQSVLVNLKDVMQAVLILLFIGSLIGLWIYAGIVPAIVYWGLELMHPAVFLPVSSLICVLVSLATGSSWSTAGTVGVALTGAGIAMGHSPGLVAGALVSGAYFGDKMSPFSETTNLASSMAGTDLFRHIYAMTFTTVPALVISLVLYTFLGFSASKGAVDHKSILASIESGFNVQWYVFLPALITLIAILKKLPAIVAISLGCLTGAVCGILFQPYESASVLEAVIQVLKVAAWGFDSATGNATVDSLLSRGGMESMLTTIWLIIAAMYFAGILQGSGMLSSISHHIVKGIRRKGGLISATVLTATGANLITSEQYLSIVITGRTFKKSYEEFELADENLSRALEDSGTLTSALIPWNTCGAFMSGALGVAVLSYAPYAFLNYLTPLISLIYAWTGLFILPRNEPANGSENFPSEP